MSGRYKLGRWRGGWAPIPIALSVLYAALMMVHGADLPGTVSIADHGRSRVFEVARGELAIRGADGTDLLTTVPTTASAQGMRELAESRRATGERVRLVLYEHGVPRSVASRRMLADAVLVELSPGTDATDLAARVDAATRGRVGYATNYAVFTVAGSGDSIELAERLRMEPGVATAEPLLARMQSKRTLPDDTHFPSQWHLRNTGQNGGTPGIDVNVTDVWDSYTGAGVMVGIIDDGLQYTHPDLSANANTSIDWDWNQDDATPLPADSDDNHGTCVAGVAAATGDNGMGVAGAAFDATLVGLRLIGGYASDADEAGAMAHRNDVIHIKNNSWGPYDDGKRLEGPGPLTKAALAAGAATGRGGRGTVYVWSCGNGGDVGDDANYDGYANSIYTLAVGAVNDRGQQAFYSEPGACVAVVAPSSGDAAYQGITTTDRTGAPGYNAGGGSDLADDDYTRLFGGTSSSAPLVSGVIALLLQCNPSLGWRDVQEILMASAVQVDPGDADWTLNAAGLHINHAFGAGLVDAAAAMALAAGWINLPPQTNVWRQAMSLSLPIPDNNAAGVVRGFDFSATGLRVEHVAVTVSLTHIKRGQLAITLVSPDGTESRLAEKHGDAGDHYAGWTFTSVRHWGESSDGEWTVRVADLTAGTAGTLSSLRVDLYGAPDVAGPPRLALTGTAFSDGAGGNGNGNIDPGEVVRETVVLRNAGGSNAVSVAGTLWTDAPGITIVEGSAVYGDIAPGFSASNAVPFSYRVAKSVPCNTTFVLRHVSAMAGGGILTNLLERRVGSASVALVTNTFLSTDVPKTLPDFTSSLSELQVPEGAVIQDVDVAVRIDHNYASDLVLSLLHPDGTELLLSDQNGGTFGSDYGTGACGANVQYTVFDDEASTSIAAAPAPFAGRYRPEEALDVLAGKPAAGTWWLDVRDAVFWDSGVLQCWGIRVVTVGTQSTCTVYNNAPVAGAVEGVTMTNEPIVIVLAGSDPDGDALTFGTNSAWPVHGALSTLDAATGTVLFLPAPGFAGEDAFTYRVSDGFGGEATGSVSVMVESFVDRDRDRLPDEWEDGNGLDSTDDGRVSQDNGPDGDPDQDGFSNLEEYGADTNPTNDASRLKITGISWEPGGVRVAWQGGVLAGQQLERRYSLTSTSEHWQAVFSNPPPTPLMTNRLDGGATGAPVFFRLKARR